MTAPSTPPLHQTTYDRSAASIGVVHLGYGAFHRAHQAVYLDDLMEITGDLRWGVAAVNLRGAESATFANHARSANGYIVKSVAPDGQADFRRVRCHLAFLDWSADAATAEDLLAQPGVHMVTITVTESGYYTDAKGLLNPRDSTIAAEVAGGPARSVYAYLAAGLARRIALGGGPLTILCCDNIRQNGKKLAKNLGAYLRLSGKTDIADWLAGNATFPCSMVDRITPRTTAAVTAEIEAIFGTDPATPIQAEAFSQWVVEDRFAGPMPDLAAAGVTVTADVDPFEEAKIRILNGGHTALAYLAALQRLDTFDQAMRVPALAAHFWGYERDEVLVGLDIPLPFDKADYLDSVAARFSNAAIADAIERICADGWTKFPIFIQPTMAGCLEQGIVPVHGLRSVASWYVFARHIAAGRLSIAYLEPAWDQLLPMLDAAGRDAFIASDTLWGDLPTTYPAFGETLRREIMEMEQKWPV